MASDYHMIDVGAKPITRRTAIASGVITVGSIAFPLVRDRILPKGDALVLAQIAGIQGAKHVSSQIPLCHPLPLDQVDVRYELDEAATAIQVFCIATAQARTGVEMEALAGVTTALLTIYDLTKMVEPALQMSHIRLLAKTGGKSGTWLHPEGVPDWVRDLIAPPTPRILEGVHCAVLTLSDRAARGDATDTSGPLAQTMLRAAGAAVDDVRVIPDDGPTLTTTVNALRAAGDVRCLVTTGGTGVAPRDITPDTLVPLLDRVLLGLGEYLRASGAASTPYAWLSRSVVGTMGSMLVIALPGSPSAVRDGLTVLLPLLPHIISVLEGHYHG